MQAVDIGVGILERHAIGKQANIFLELLQSGLGVRAKIAVVLTAGKTQNVERALQGLNVGAMEIGHAQIERAVASLYEASTRRSNRGYRRRSQREGHCRA